MRFSNYTLRVETSRSRVLLVGLRTRSAIELDKSILTYIDKYLGDQLDLPPPSIEELLLELKRCKIIVDSNEDELEKIVTSSLASRFLNDTFAAIIVPTIGCNLRCSYCFQPHMHHAKDVGSDNSEDVVTFIKSKLTNNNFNNLHVRWFGGEPLQAIHKIENISSQLIRECEEMEINYSADIVTNGTLLNQDIIEKLVNCKVEDVQITFDGGRIEHNKKRRGPDFRNSYDLILKNLVLVTKYMRANVRVHVAPYNIDTIPYLLEDMVALGLESKIDKLYFAPLFNYKQSQKEIAFFPNERLFLSSSDFAIHQVELHRLALKHGFSLPDPLESDYGVCTALRENTVVIDHNGRTSKCYMDVGDNSESFGDLTGAIDQPENLDKWRTATFSNDAECRKCTFAPVCLGACTKQRIAAEDKSSVCTPLKFNYESLLPIHYKS